MEPIEFETDHGFGMITSQWSEGILPRATEAERKWLEQSIERDGVLEPVITWQGKIVDGHMRAEICEKLGIEPPRIEKEFESREHAEVWVMRRQLGRRNLDVVGRCEMAEKFEELMKPYARERMAEGGRISGKGAKLGEGTPAAGIPSGADDVDPPPRPPSPYGGLLDDVLREKGSSHDKAAKVAGVGQNRYGFYKAMKKHHLPQGAAAAALTPKERKKRRKDWEAILAEIRGPAPKLSVEKAHKKFDAGVRAETRAADNARRSDEARARAIRTGESANRPWGADGPVWCKGEFQAEANLDDLPDGEVGLVLCDPPYGQNYNPDDGHRPPVDGDVDVETAAALLREMLEKMHPKLAPNAHVVFFCGVWQEPRMRQVLEDFEVFKGSEYLVARSHLVWMKNRQGAPGDTQNAFAPWHERAIHATRGNPKWGDAGRPRDAYHEIESVRSDDHLTPKPVDLLRQIIMATTVEHEWVADPFGGIGSTVLAALGCNRRAWGAEKEPKHYDAGYANIDRLIKEMRQGKKVHLPESSLVVPPREQPPKLGFAGASAAPSKGLGFVHAKAAPKPKPSIEELAVPEPGAFAWGWAK